MAGKFEISKNANGTFAFAFKDEDKIYAESPVFEKRMSAREALRRLRRTAA